MSKDFYAARAECQEALLNLQVELNTHRNILNSFKKAHAELDESVPDAVGDVLKEAIHRETLRVGLLEAQIRNTQRTLREKYSLAPATVD